MNNLHERKPTRLKDYDYSTPRAYFITICATGMKQYFSKIVGEALAPPENKLTVYGKIADKNLQALNMRYPHISVDKYVIMPNHIHLILMINTGAASSSPTIVDVVRALKSMITIECKKNGFTDEKVFQRSFHDHIIRGENDYRKIWEYIDTNVIRWKDDCFYDEQ
ncbi:MAG: transposase [Clostridia bacterium]|nr:transposase [Clostridia bacterium]